MSEDSQRAWVENQISNAVALDHPEVSVWYNNTKPPKDTPYLAYTIMTGSGKQSEIVRGGFERHVGVIQIDVMVPDNTGSGELTRLADWITAKFSRASAVLSDGAYLNCKVGYSTYLGVNNGIARRSCTIPFWRDERP